MTPPPTTAPAIRIGADGRGEMLGPGGAWRFEVDLTSRTAILEDGRGGTRVRPPTWRERAALARFTGLGEAFRTRALARACATRPQLAGEGGSQAPGPGAGADVAPPHDALIAALAAWLEDPSGDLALPEDPAGLAAMALDLCRRTGLRPADVDALPAYEVAELWAASAPDASATPDAEALSGADGWAEPADDGSSRIVIVDDPEPDAPTSLGASPGAAERQERPVASRLPSGERERELGAATGRAPLAPSGRGPGDAAAPARSGPLQADQAHPAHRAHRAPRLGVRRVAADPPTLGGARVAPAEVKELTTSPHGGSPRPDGVGAAGGDSPPLNARLGVSGSPVAEAPAPPQPSREAAAWTSSASSPARVGRPAGDAVKMPDRPRAAKSATWAGPAIDERGDAPAAFVQLSAQALAPLSRQQWAAPAVPEGTWDDETALGGGLGPGAQEALLAQLADELALAATLLGIGEGD